jgi:hypothetical protein
LDLAEFYWFLKKSIGMKMIQQILRSVEPMSRDRFLLKSIDTGNEEFNTKVLNSEIFGFLWNPNNTEEIKLCLIDRCNLKRLHPNIGLWVTDEEMLWICVTDGSRKMSMKCQDFNTKVLKSDGFGFLGNH